MELLISVVDLAVRFLFIIIITQFIISLLIIFNVVSQSNQFISGVYNALNTLLNPILNPIRKILPDTGMIDFSPMVLIFGLMFLQRALLYAAGYSVI
ncbi:MAG: YggT family protein [Sphingorhabdus sp.]